MIVSISQFTSLARDAQGHQLPVTGSRLTCEVRTTAGAFAALSDVAKVIRIATDTGIHLDINGGATTSADEFFPANSVEYIAVNGGETLTIAAVA